MPILCINCVHYRKPAAPGLSVETYSQCHHPSFISRVTGELDPRTCSVQRDSKLEGYCGPEAKFYECGKRIDEDDEDSALCGDEGRLCLECSKREGGKYAYLKFASAPEGSAEYERDMRDAGRAHFLP